jgi:predicted small metal-binding protein
MASQHFPAILREVAVLPKGSQTGKEENIMSTNANVQQKKLICRAPDCHFEVRDIEEDELIRITQDHAQRKHQTSLPAEYLQTAIQPVEQSVQEGR